MAMTDALAAGLLIAALVLFWISTGQFALWQRLALIGAGAAALAGAAWQANKTDKSGPLALLADALGHIARFGDSLIGQTLSGNAASVEGSGAALLGFFVVLAGLAGILALIALTPGEAVERAIRPIKIGAIGMMAGAALALGAVAIGFGGPVKQRVYIGEVEVSVDDKGTPQGVHDGDTFSIGDVSIRLNGVDAPEMDQLCLDANNSEVPCAQMARDHLVSLVRDAIVICTPPDADVKFKESFGRPILNCKARQPGKKPFDINQTMIRDGYAVAYRGLNAKDEKAKQIFVRRYEEEEKTAAQKELGLMPYCFLDPVRWRRDEGRQDRSHFENDELKAIGLGDGDGVNKRLFGAACENLIQQANGDTNKSVAAPPTSKPAAP
jgi:endonuclease YncB( thermonuclease family)